MAEPVMTAIAEILIDRVWPDWADETPGGTREEAIAEARHSALALVAELEARGYRIVVGACPACQHSWRSHGPAGVSAGCYAKRCTCRAARPADLPLEEMPAVLSNVGSSDG